MRGPTPFPWEPLAEQDARLGARGPARVEHAGHVWLFLAGAPAPGAEPVASLRAWTSERRKTTWLAASYLWSAHEAAGSRLLGLGIPLAEFGRLTQRAVEVQLDPEDRMHHNAWRQLVRDAPVLEQSARDRALDGRRCARRTWLLGLRPAAMRALLDLPGLQAVDLTARLEHLVGATPQSFEVPVAVT